MTHTEYLQRRNIGELNGVRALSVLLVITVHVHTQTWLWLGGQKGVTFFFILSGYLITFLALREESEKGRLSLKAFYIRRTFRIFPVYYFVLLVYVALIFLLGVRPDKQITFSAALPYDALYLQEIPFFFGINGVHENIPFYHTWSLGIEEKFYLVWPLLIFVLLATRKALRSSAALCLLPLFAIAGLLGSGLGGCLFSYFDILLGCLLALLLNSEANFNYISKLGKPIPLLLITLAMGVVQLLSAKLAKWPYFYPIDILHALIFAIFFAGLLTAKGRIQRLFGSSVLSFLGTISYGIYLVHILCINAVESTVHRFISTRPGIGIDVLVLCITIAMATFIAWIIFVTVERPLIAVGRRWSQRIIAAE